MNKQPITKPTLSFWQIWNMSFGFLGIQFGFALQNGNASRILQAYGADIEHLSLFWLAAPLTGMIVQPLVGHYSDRTWTGLGRRRPYILAGALFAAIALVLMPNAGQLFTIAIPPLMIGAGMLMIMDASFNVAMEPFRALVADNLSSQQRSQGFSIQTCLIGIGAVLGSALPYLLAEYMGVEKTASEGHIPDNVVFSFYVGAAVMVLALGRTVFTTKEYTDKELSAFHPGIEKEEERNKGLKNIISDFLAMPTAMKQLGLVQFFSWFALFSMWVFSTPAIAQHVYGLNASDTSSSTYADAANWVGVLFGIYNGVSALFALSLPLIARKFGRKRTHAISLTAGGIGLISIFFIDDPNLLVFSMIGIGFAWGSILAMPYAILADSLPPYKMGVYMGLFNFFITFPQIVNGFFGGWMVKQFFDGEAIYAIILAGVAMVIAAISVLFVKDERAAFKSN
ncbi:MFS transporter [Albibacterium indicum]|uniref:MFS transporter n=1 Tax=Albibacterium indicum TaxID=2292082 RepID=UPI000E495E85|nr:MFS transporter [Pedobacter indicus]